MSEQMIIAEAIKQYASGNISQSETLFRQVLSMNHSNADALYFLGIIALSKGIMGEACQLLYQATLLQPHNTDYTYSLATALQESGKFDEAIVLYQKIPQMAESQNNLGNIFLAKGELDKAEVHFDKALGINKNMIWALVNKAILMRQKKQFKEAQKLLLNALKINPDFIPALYQISILLRENGQAKEAFSHIKKAIQLTNATDFIFVEYGKVLTILDDKKKALQAYDKAIDLNRFCQDAYFEKARLLEKTDPKLSEKLYCDLIRINPQHIAAYNNLGTLLYTQNRTAEALEMYRQVVILNPHDPLASFNLAVALEDLGEYEEAAGLYFNVLSLKAYENQVHIRLASLLSKLYETNPKQAKDFAKGWVKNFPDNPFAIHTQNALKGKADTQENNYSYTLNLYDAFADTYEEKMQELSCSVPQKIADLLKEKHFDKALDIGCGTGLSGIAIAPFCDKIIGVDASRPMLEKAKEKRIYDTLVNADISDFLSENKTKYDLVVAADVFCYINELEDIFKLIHTHLKKDGIFVFSIEHNKDDTQRISPQGRYQHSDLKIQNTLKNLGFSNVFFQKTNLRKEGNGMCEGLLYFVEK